MQLKQKLLTTIFSVMSVTSVMAGTVKILPVADAFSSAEMMVLFEQNEQPLQLAALSTAEMKTTEGAWWPYVAAGAAGGLASGINYYHTNSRRTWGGWGTAVGTGVVGGAMTASRWWSSAFWGGGTVLAGSWAAPRVSRSTPRPVPQPERVKPHFYTCFHFCGLR